MGCRGLVHLRMRSLRGFEFLRRAFAQQSFGNAFDPGRSRREIPLRPLMHDRNERFGLRFTAWYAIQHQLRRFSGTCSATG